MRKTHSIFTLIFLLLFLLQLVESKAQSTSIANIPCTPKDGLVFVPIADSTIVKEHKQLQFVSQYPCAIRIKSVSLEQIKNIDKLKFSIHKSNSIYDIPSDARFILMGCVVEECAKPSIQLSISFY